MDENICEQCGTRNEPGAQFCVECQAFLPWYDTRETNLQALGVDTGTGTAAAGSPADAAPTAPVADVAAPVTPSAEASTGATAGTAANAGSPSPVTNRPDPSAGKVGSGSAASRASGTADQ